MTVLLEVEGLAAGYGDATVLRDIGFTVRAHEIVAIVGANGAGKTTLLATIAGLIAPQAGRVRFAGHDITDVPAHLLPKRGLTLVPEGGRLFPFMTVRENLELGAYARHGQGGAARMEEMMALFPNLRERAGQLAGSLSGGERQMCAIARALMSRPSLLLLDEPSVGLSPLMVGRVLDLVARLVRHDGLTVMIVEQRVTEVLDIADFAHILDHGHLARSGPAAELRADRQLQEAYMGL